MMKRCLYILVLLLWVTGCTPKPTPTATPTPTLQPTPTHSPTPTTTYTPTPTVTLTPTPTNTPTKTPRPSFTPTSTSTSTPEGFYTSSRLAFSLLYPTDWETIGDSKEGLIIIDLPNQITFLGQSFIEEEQTPLEEVINIFQKPQTGIFKSSKVIKQEKIKLADEIEADYVILTGKNVNNVDITLHLVYARKEDRTYTFIIMGPTENVEDNIDSVMEIFSSIKLLRQDMFGIERNKSLTRIIYYEPDPVDLDPARQLGGAEALAGLLYSGLVVLTPQLEIAPDLAESWQMSPDGTVYTFTLRSDVYFQSGKPITAEDVRYSWERAADPETKSTTAATYMGDILGFKAKLNGEADEISGVNVLDELTLVVTLDGSKPYFLAKLSYPSSFVIDRDGVEADPENWMYHPNASGPFILREYSEGNVIIFERNMEYHTPSKLQYAVYLINKPGNALDYYEKGEIDFAYISDPDIIHAIQGEDHPLHDEMLSSTRLCTSYIHINNTIPPMDDINVRKAFALAIDRQKLIDQFSSDTTLLAQTILPPAMPGFSPQLSAAEYNPDQAKAALAASSYAQNLPRIVLNRSGSGTGGDRYANVIIDMWRKVLGVTVEIEYLGSDNYTKAAHEQHGQMVYYSWCADYPDPENFLDVLFYTDSDFNVAGYTNPEIDTRLEQARTEIDPVLRMDMYKEIEAMLLEDFSVIPLRHSVNWILIKPYVKDFVFPPMDVRWMNLIGLDR